ncbi:MAG: DUF2809 domain-containing protein [Bryobacteraceae bacterium]
MNRTTVRRFLIDSIPAAVSLIFIVPIGFYSKFYRGPAADWVNDSLGGFFYDIFWCLMVFLVRPHWKPRWIAAGVLGATCVLEFMQLWHPPFLELIRSHFLGRTIIGTTFDWMDFPYYFIGSGVGWYWLERLRRMRTGGPSRRRAIP